MAIFDQIISLNRQMLGGAKLGMKFLERFVFLLLKRIHIRMKLITVLLVALTMSVASVSAQGMAGYKLNKISSTEFLRAYSYLMGQVKSIELIDELFPNRLISEKLKFDAAFPNIVEKMEQVAQNNFGSDYVEQHRKKAFKAINDHYSQIKIDTSLVNQFKNDLSRRAEGNIASPVLEILLAVQFYDNPVAELLYGHGNRFSSTGHQKSKGVNILFDVPKSFSEKEGKRPNTLKQWTSQNGWGLEIINIVINDFGVTPTEDDVKAYANDENELAQSLMPGMTLINTQFSYIENQPFITLVSQGEITRANATLEVVMAQSQIFYKDKLITLTCMSEPNRRSKIEALCNQIINSVVFPDLYIAVSTPEKDLDQGLAAYNNGDYATALAKWKPLAEAGGPSAQYYLGLVYFNGQGVPKNLSKAMEWFRLAAEQGILDAQTQIGFAYRNGLGVTQDNQEAAKWYFMAAEQGFAPAQFNLGIMYRNGWGVTQDYKKAVKWYLLAAEQGHANAQYNLGFAYRHGRGIAQDLEEAVRWYQMAGEQGFADAQSNLGFMYQNGLGVPQSYNSAVKWFRLAADQGMAQAQLNLGSAYELGQGVPQDDIQAATWFQRAAEQGLASAQFNLGNMYQNGRGVGQDYKKASNWFLSAANQGFAIAQFSLGRMYEKGLGVSKDYSEAAKWYLLAGEQGLVNAQYNLGVLYSNGQGVLQDYLEAIKWLKLAAEQGKFEAQYNLALMYANGRGVRRDNLTAYMWLYIASSENKLAARVGETRDELAKRMTNAEIAQGTLWAKECLNSGYTMCGY